MNFIKDFNPGVAYSPSTFSHFTAAGQAFRCSSLGVLWTRESLWDNLLSALGGGVSASIPVRVASAGRA
ncbi:MAG TPA: hypothetical protein DIT07_03730 [Sphingobacteriaceae bacterium]|nr:hypothetical protein [Sphingobacteriaceae bacterium]